MKSQTKRRAGVVGVSEDKTEKKRGKRTERKLGS